jgi:TRAP-type C4-dicarboxylate transport system permease small subunit
MELENGTGAGMPAPVPNSMTPREVPRGELVSRIRWPGDVLAWIVNVALVAFMSIIVISLVTQVFSRYVLERALIWPEELARYSFVWLSFLGVPLLLRNGWLMRFDAMLRPMPAGMRRRIAFIIEFSPIPLLVILVFQGFVMVRLVQVQVAPSLGISMRWVYLSAPVSGMLGLWFVFERLITGSAYQTQGSIYDTLEK